jgi:hypothetical protein
MLHVSCFLCAVSTALTLQLFQYPSSIYFFRNDYSAPRPALSKSLQYPLLKKFFSTKQFAHLYIHQARKSNLLLSFAQVDSDLSGGNLNILDLFLHLNQ